MDATITTSVSSITVDPSINVPTFNATASATAATENIYYCTIPEINDGDGENQVETALFMLGPPHDHELQLVDAIDELVTASASSAPPPSRSTTTTPPTTTADSPSWSLNSSPSSSAPQTAYKASDTSPPASLWSLPSQFQSTCNTDHRYSCDGLPLTAIRGPNAGEILNATAGEAPPIQPHLARQTVNPFTTNGRQMAMSMIPWRTTELTFSQNTNLGFQVVMN